MLRHRFYLNHQDGNPTAPWGQSPDTFSGPLSKTDARRVLMQRLAQGLAGRLEEYWEGPCRRCAGYISVPTGYYQHGCGEVYDKDSTL